MEDKMQIIKDFEKLLRSTREFSDVVITYGGMTYKDEKRTFIPSDHILSDRDLEEYVFVKWEGAGEGYGVYQCVECDSGSALIQDIWKAVNEL